MVDRTNVNDRRVVRTRAAVVAAFDTLLLEKDMSQITVTDIAREANIDRKTFYTHFGSVDGLVDYIVDTEMASIHERLKNRMQECGEAGVSDNLEIMLEVIGETIRESRIVNKKNANLAPARRLARALHDVILKTIDECGGPLASLEEDAKDCVITFMVLGTAAVYRCKTIDHPSMSDEEVSSIAVQLVSGGIRSYGKSLAAR